MLYELSAFAQEIKNNNLKSSKNLAIIYIESERSNLSKKSKCNWWSRLPQCAEKVRCLMATRREMLNVIASGNINEDVIAWAATEIEKLDRTNEARRNKPSKKALENAPLIEALVNELTDEPQTATYFAEKFEISPQKASGLLGQIVKAGRATKVDLKIKGKGVQKGYLIAE